MRRTSLFLILTVFIFGGMLFSQTQEPKKKYNVKRAAIYREEALVIAETDWNCLYFIKGPVKNFEKQLKKEITITGAEHQELSKRQYSDGDTMYINKGASSGIKEGTVYMALGVGKLIKNPLNGKKLGHLYVKKALVTIKCTYDDKAIITVTRACQPVEIGDILVPYVERKPLYQKKAIFNKCRLPNSSAIGTVVYSGMYMENIRVTASTEEQVSIDLGKSGLAIGDWVVFYKIYAKNLPPVIVGTGIVLNTEDTNSTVKVIETVSPIDTGTKAVLIPGMNVLKETESAISTSQPTEDEPMIGNLDENGPGTEKKGFELDILFDFNEVGINDEYKTQMEKIKDFVAANPNYEVVLRGYCCSIGGAEYNLKLSQKRVESIKQYLVTTYGIPVDAIETNYLGEKEAPHDNSTEAERKLNRLVKIEVIEK